MIARSVTEDKPYYQELTGISRDFRFTGLPLDAEFEITASHPNFDRSIRRVRTKLANDRKYLPIEVFPIYYHAR